MIEVAAAMSKAATHHVLRATDSFSDLSEVSAWKSTASTPPRPISTVVMIVTTSARAASPGGDIALQRSIDPTAKIGSRADICTS
eukprot:5891-Heterococcus_DN1.PRE.2